MHKKTRSVYIALLTSSGLLAVLLLGCGNGRKAEAEDAAHAPTAPVVKVARRDLSNTLEIASEFQPFRKSRFTQRFPATSKSLHRLGNAREAGAAAGGAGNSRTPAAIAAG